MPTFRCQPLAAASLAASPPLEVEAPDRAAALRHFIQRGITPAHLEEVAAQRPAA